jgi:hypothetical protein
MCGMGSTTLRAECRYLITQPSRQESPAPMSAKVRAAVGERGVPSAGGRPPWRWSGRHRVGAEVILPDRGLPDDAVDVTAPHVGDGRASTSKAGKPRPSWRPQLAAGAFCCRRAEVCARLCTYSMYGHPMGGAEPS